MVGDLGRKIILTRHNGQSRSPVGDQHMHRSLAHERIVQEPSRMRSVVELIVVYAILMLSMPAVLLWVVLNYTADVTSIFLSPQGEASHKISREAHT